MGVGEWEVVMNRPDRKFRKRFAVLVTGGVLVAALFPMAGSVLAAVPAAPSAPDLLATSDSGPSSTDNITNVTTPTFSGTALTNSTVRLFAGTTEMGHVDTSTGTTWTITSSPALVEGTYSFTATQSTVDGTSGTSLALPVSIFTSLGVTINQASGQADPTGTSPINFTVVFTHAVTDFATGDVTLGGTAGATTATVTGSGTTYNVAVSGMTTGGTVTASIAAGKASDLAGNLNTASTSTDNTVTLGNTFLVTSSNYTPVPGGAVTISAQLANAAGTAIATSGLVVTWSSTNGGSFSTATSTTNASGIATVTFTVSSTAGTIHTITATGGGFTGTSTNITVSANATVITLTTSAPTPPGAHDPVITWGQAFTLGIQFAASGSGKTVALQGTRDGTTWTTITSLTMGSSGGTSYRYTPVTNLWYRAVFAGTSDLGAATSNQVRTVVREIALLRPTNFGHVRTISRNTSVTFTTTVRPARPELAPAKVSFWFYRQSGGSWVLAAKRDVVIDSAGLAHTTFTFTSSGQWYVRLAANPTPYNANSVMSPVERYSVL
jgi:Bacterial Ig-like domain